MRFEHLNWYDVETYLNTERRLIFITGATEQHGTLSLLTDILIPEAIADEAARSEKVLIAPPLNYGVSPYFAAFPGSVSLRLETFVSLVKEIAAQFIGQGFSHILFMNGHGGNPIKAVVDDLSAQFPDSRLVSYNWWQSARTKAFCDARGLLQSHANWQENFPFNRLGNAPDGGKPAPTIPLGASPQQTRQAILDGTYGGPFQVPDEIMDALRAEVVAEVRDLLRGLKLA